MASSRKGVPDLPGRVAACLRQFLPRRGRLTVGYSGGLDSTVLLHLLAGLRASHGFSLRALHVHHGLSPHADAWSAHCGRQCERLGVPLSVTRVRVESVGEGPEAAAREARYRAFAQLDTDVLALAHHRDDEAETVLLQLLRGGGPKGLAAMPEARWLEGRRVRLVRPLLSASRAELESWAHGHGIEWIEDESNRLTHLTRNALRHEILPLVESRFPGAVATLARAAGQFAETAALLDQLADLDAREVVSPAGLDVARLADLPEPRARNLLRRHLEQSGATIHQANLREALRQILDARGDARVEVAFGGCSLRRFRGRALVVRSSGRLAAKGTGSASSSVAWRGESVLDLVVRGNALGRLRFQAVKGVGVRLEPGPVSIRFRRGGEALRTDPRRPRRCLKDLLREAAVPPWQRTQLPLVYVGDCLAWVAEIGSDAAFSVEHGEPGWLITWEPISPDRPS
jgi:tRNA(Ile)-lysidine synthase